MAGRGPPAPTGSVGTPGRGAPLAYFSPTGKVGKSVLKKTRNGFLENLSLFLLCFALTLWLVCPKPGRVPCMSFCGYLNMFPRTVKRWCGGSLGALVVFVLVQLLVAPFHYAKEKCFVYGPTRNIANCVVERSNQ